MAWSWWALPGVLVFAAGWIAAVVVLRTAPRRAINRRIAVVLALEGTFMGCAAGLLFLFESQAVSRAFAIAGTAAMLALPFQYLAFLGASLETPLVRPFRSGRAFLILTLISAAAAALVVVSPGSFLQPMYDPGWATWNAQYEPGGEIGARIHGLASLFGLVAALSAWSRTRPGSAARSRAKWFAIAFGVRDAFVGAVQVLYPVLRPIEFWGDVIYNPVSGVVYLVYVMLLAYGILRTQLFDIDLRIRLALTQSTLGAIVAAIFLVVSELLESFVAVEGRVAGLLAALAIVALLRPAQSLARRFANRLMPSVQDSPEYLGTRKLDVYRAALEGAIQDGSISPRERDILTRLRQQLELSAAEADAAEAELLRAMPPTP